MDEDAESEIVKYQKLLQMDTKNYTLRVKLALMQRLNNQMDNYQKSIVELNLQDPYKTAQFIQIIEAIYSSQNLIINTKISDDLDKTDTHYIVVLGYALDSARRMRKILK